MDTHRRTRQRSFPLRRAGAWLAAVLVISATYSCSLLIESRSEQCEVDSDCSAGFKCDKSAHVCITASSGSGGSGGTGMSSSSSTSSSSSSSSTTSSGMTCEVDAGAAGECWSCAPTEESQILNHCTDAQCFPFDNVTRIAALADGGKLPPLGDGGP